MFRSAILAAAAVWVLAGALPAQAALLQGPAYIQASTNLPVYSGWPHSINEIADGISADFNGWAGANGLVGTIQLDLLGTYDITSFSLWNDINIVREGVGDFQLHFYDAQDQLISDSAVFTAPISSFAPGVYNFAAVQGVSRVDLEVLTLLTGGVCCRIEIREVAFNGEASSGGTVPEPSGLALAGLGLAGVGVAARRRRSTRV
jgi:hypothetical protein